MINTHLQKAVIWYEDRPSRERWGLFLVALLLLYVLWSHWVWNAAIEEYRTLEAQKYLLMQQLEQIKKQTLILQHPPAPSHKTQMTLNERLAVISLQLKQIALNPLSAKDALEWVVRLLKIRQISLTSFKEIPLTTDSMLPSEISISGKTLYRHDWEIQFTSNYATTLDFLQAVARARQSIMGKGLRYQVTQYPDAHVTLQLSVLSDQ